MNINSENPVDEDSSFWIRPMIIFWKIKNFFKKSKIFKNQNFAIWKLKFIYRSDVTEVQFRRNYNFLTEDYDCPSSPPFFNSLNHFQWHFKDFIKVSECESWAWIFKRSFHDVLTLLLTGFLTNDYSRGGVFRTPKLFSANFDLFLDSWNHYWPIYS